MFDNTLTRYSYVLYLTEKKINEVILLFGTTHQQIKIDKESGEIGLISQKGKEINIDKAIYLFLNDIGFIADGIISEKGRAYFRAVYVLKDDEHKQTFIQEKILANPVIALISQVFYGRGDVTPQQVKMLLLSHQIIDNDIKDSELSSFLMFINKYGIIAYSKKTVSLRVLAIPEANTIQQYFVEPTLPFTNIYNFRKILRSSCGDIYWLDKHFRKQGLEIIIDGLPFQGVKSVTIISGKENASESAKEEYLRLKEELSYRKVDLVWKLIQDETFIKQWHDRWIVADNYSYNIPPILTLVRGQRAEIIKTEKPPNIKEFLSCSVNLT